jgi:DNA-binding GntR family transcriptional regulator
MRTAILKGDFAPGTELKQDRVAELFGVSRIPVREALQMLQRDGLVLVKPNRRVVVAEMTEDLLTAMRSVPWSKEAAARAAATNTDLSMISSAQQRNEEARRAEDLTAFLSASAVFHRSIWDAAGGSRLKALASELWSGRDYTPSHLPEQLKRATEEHLLIAEAIRLRSPQQARQMMTEHIMRTAESSAATAQRSPTATANRMRW